MTGHMGQVALMAETGQLIAVLVTSGNPSQTTHNVKIMFINIDFLKMNECK